MVTKKATSTKPDQDVLAAYQRFKAQMVSGDDNRPWAVKDAAGNVVIRCWYEETAVEYIKTTRRKDLTAVKVGRKPKRNVLVGAPVPEQPPERMAKRKRPKPAPALPERRSRRKKLK